MGGSVGLFSDLFSYWIVKIVAIVISSSSDVSVVIERLGKGVGRCIRHGQAYLRPANCFPSKEK